MKREVFFIIIAAIFYGTITVGGQFLANLGLSLYEIALFPVSVIAILMSLIVIYKRKFLIKRGMLRFFIIYGLIGAVLQVTQFGGIILGIPVAVVAFLLYTQPIWTTIIGKVLLQEKITQRKVLTVIIGFMGILVLLKPWDIENIGNLGGISFALIAGILLSLWVILGRKSGINKQHYITTTFGYAFFSTIWLWLLLPISSLFIQNSMTRISFSFPVYYWFYVIFFAFLWGIISHPFFYAGVKRVPASIAGVILLLEPVSASLLAALLFGQEITSNIIFGGILILLSNYLIIPKKGN